MGGADAFPTSEVREAWDSLDVQVPPTGPCSTHLARLAASGEHKPARKQFRNLSAGGRPDQVAAGADSRESREPCGHRQVCVLGTQASRWEGGSHRLCSHFVWD